MRRQSHALRSEVVPSEQAIEIIGQFYSNSDRLLIMAQSGSHNLNSYHNTVHELQNVYYAFSCFTNDSAKKDGPGPDSLIKASLFHDHNHSGGLKGDDINVFRALDFAEREVGFNDKELSIIRCTQFMGGKFPFEPTNLAEKSIRDADLMTIYSNEGHRLMIGLFEEMSRKPISKFTTDEVKVALTNTWNFLSAQTMYTDHGKRMRDEHLASQFVKLETHVWQRHSYETEYLVERRRSDD